MEQFKRGMKTTKAKGRSSTKSLNEQLRDLKKLAQTPTGFALIAVILGVLAFTIQGSGSPKVAENRPVFETADTYIPEGHTMLPIEVVNYESLDSIIGRFGVVDLFTAPVVPGQKPRPIAFRLKIMRSPRSRSHFAVLVNEEQAQKVMSFPGPYRVTVRNRKEYGTKFVKEKVVRPKRRIEYNLE